MRIKFTLFVLLTATVFSARAQLHLGKSKNELIASLGTNHVDVYDEDGNEVIAYVNEVKNHPKFGDYTLYAMYIFEKNSCVMQQTITPVSQKDELIAGFSSLYEKIEELIWKSKEGIYYILSADRESLRMKIMSDSIYQRNLR